MIKDKKEYRFLIIEDNPGDFAIVREFLVEQISKPAIVHAINYKQATEILQHDQGFNAILLDISLPDKAGQQLVIEMLRINSSRCPIIILTGYTDIDFSIKSISLGIMDYLLKDDLTATALYKSIVYSIERKNNLLELQASKNRYSDLFNLSPQPMWLFETETFKFVQVNKAALRLYGYSEEEFLNMTPMEIKLEDDINKAKKDLQKNNPGDGIFKETIKHHKKSGEIIEVEIYSTPITINDTNFRSVIVIDVTEKNLYEHKIIKAIIKTQEDERYEIGGELHDNVCQILAASQMSLGMLKDSIKTSKIPLYDQCRGNIKLALDEIRNLSHRLAPAFFDDSTLEEAFRRLFKNFNLEKDHKILFDIEDEVMKNPISFDVQLNFYRILQEQLRNILKYAKATVIKVDLLIYKKMLKMRIADNGVGFNLAMAKGGIGLANIKRRTELFGGKFEIYTSPGHGCEIVINIPLPQIISLPLNNKLNQFQYTTT